MPRNMLRLVAAAVALGVVAACGSTDPVEHVATVEPPAVVQVDEWRPWPAMTTTSTTSPATTSTTAPPPAPRQPVRTQAATAPVQARVGPCGGWESTVAAHFPAEQVGTACSKLMCESGGNPSAQNARSSAAGLFQLLEIHAWRFESFGWSWADRYDGPKNTAVAAMLWREQGWGPWVC